VSTKSLRSGALPSPKATELYARTVERELRRAGYEPADMLRFVGELVGLIGHGSVNESSAIGVVDPETGLPDPSSAEAILSFELRRASDRLRPLLVMMIDVELPEWCPDDEVSAYHVRLAVELRQCLRQDDTVVRLSPERYLAILPNGTRAMMHAFERRAAQLCGNRIDVPPGFALSLRHALWSTEAPADLLTACATAEAIRLEPQALRSTPVLQAQAFNGVSEAAPELSTRPRVVLALGGGAGRAAAHIGILAGLAQSGIDVIGIAGTSAGALVAAMSIQGMESEAMIERFVTFNNTTVYKRMRRLYATYLRRAKRNRPGDRYFRQSGWASFSDADLAAISDEVFTEFIEHFVGTDTDIATLARPFAAVATDLVSGRPMTFTSGPLHFALRSSCAVPGMFAPQLHGDQRLVDGAVTADVPVAGAHALKLNVPVIAVYLERPRRRVTAFTTSAEVLSRANAIVHTELVREQLQHAPILLTAAVSEIPWLDFKRARETAAIGLSTAKDATAELRRRLVSPQ
jgi:NTE family protein